MAVYRALLVGRRPRLDGLRPRPPRARDGLINGRADLPVSLK